MRAQGRREPVPENRPDRFYVRAPHEGWPHSVTAGALPPGSRKVVRGQSTPVTVPAGNAGSLRRATAKGRRALRDGPGGSARSGPH
jgi:hypothetical protein